ncbi:LemA family protein [Pseudoxanthomonas composti]|uniref:LemA family protein n=1 Tax=Pseudoxanthomonas composti TaxID=2137479 RepID=A0A4Q1JVH7_9GAMM|nr:LemA family protein [Pseudoxanthomonas composti]RXR06160.1 LemA family protein [Pseudoxanthomonas composti]
MWGWIVLLVVIALPVLWGIGIYNGLVTARNAYRNAFSQIDVQLQRRFDLIPNLVETAKAYLAHERQTLDAVIAARSAAQSGLAAAKAQPGDAEAMARLSAAQGQLESGLGRLMAVAEAYPDLKGNQNMMQVSEELASTENRLSFARQAYNDSVMAYNNRREVFPASLIANNYRFGPAAPLELPSAQAEQIRAAPTVRF